MNDKEYIFTTILVTIDLKLLIRILTLLLRYGGPEVLRDLRVKAYTVNKPQNQA